MIQAALQKLRGKSSLSGIQMAVSVGSILKHSRVLMVPMTPEWKGKKEWSASKSLAIAIALTLALFLALSMALTQAEQRGLLPAAHP
jgi:hypothetical protein